MRIGCPVKLHSDPMSKLFRCLCYKVKGNQQSQRKSATSYHPQGNAMTERKNWTIEECLSEYIGQYQNELTKILPLAMMAYRSSMHSVTKYSPVYVVLGFPMSLSVDCIYSTTHRIICNTKRLCFHNETETTRNASLDARIYGFRTKTPEDLL